MRAISIRTPSKVTLHLPAKRQSGVSVRNSSPANHEALRRQFSTWVLKFSEPGKVLAEYTRLKNRLRPDQVLREFLANLDKMLGGPQAQEFQKVIEGMGNLFGGGGSSPFSGKIPEALDFVGRIKSFLREKMVAFEAEFGPVHSKEGRENRDRVTAQFGKMGLFLTLDELSESVRELFQISATDEAAIQARNSKSFVTQDGPLGQLMAPALKNMKKEIEKINLLRLRTHRQVLEVYDGVLHGSHNPPTEGVVCAAFRQKFKTRETFEAFLIEALAVRVRLRVPKDNTPGLFSLPPSIVPQEFFTAEPFGAGGEMPVTIASYVKLVKLAAEVIAERVFKSSGETPTLPIPDGY